MYMCQIGIASLSLSSSIACRVRVPVASSKFAPLKSHLQPVKKLGSKKLLPGNSVKKVISWPNKPIFTEIVLLFIRQNTILIWSKG